jgi:hypothetical protein
MTLDEFRSALARADRFTAARYMAMHRGKHARFLYKFSAARPRQMSSLLVASTLWLAARKDFNDTYEMHVNITFDGTPKEILDYFRRAARRQGFRGAERRRAAQSAYSQGDFANRAKRSFDELIDQTGVCCLSAGPARNTLMWGHYANGGRGVCFQFHTARSADPLALAIPVEYRSTEISINWAMESEQDRVGRVPFAKSIDWQHEAEHRIIDRTRVRSPLPFKPEALIGVICGARSARFTQLRVVALCRRRVALGMPPVRLYRAVPGPHFQLSIRRARDLESLVTR